MTGSPLKKNPFGCGVTIVVVVGAVAFTAVQSLFGSDVSSFAGGETKQYDSSTQVDSPAPIENFTGRAADELSKTLARAEKEHGVCFGWSLTDGSDNSTERGSSRGPNVPADTCSRWAETRVVVVENGGSGEYDYDYASIDTRASSDISPTPGAEDFVPLGFSAERLVAEPAIETGQAALALPLLLIEKRALQAAPRDRDVQEATPATPLPPSDGTNAGLTAWVWVVLFGMAAMAFTVVGFVSRSAARRAAGVAPPGMMTQPYPPAPQQPRTPQYQAAPPLAPGQGWPVQQGWVQPPQQPAPPPQGRPSPPGPPTTPPPGSAWPNQGQPPGQPPGWHGHPPRR